MDDLTEKLIFKVLDPEATVPKYMTPGASGMDITSIEEIKVPGSQVSMIRTGLAAHIPEGYELQCRSRSGLALKGLVVANSPGTIDSDYRGEMKVLLHNTTSLDFWVFPGDRIAQLVLAKVDKLPIEVTEDELDDTTRGFGGFGSTGRN